MTDHTDREFQTCFECGLSNRDCRCTPLGYGIPTDGGDPGMSLRDWFAGQAIGPMISAYERQNEEYESQDIVEIAYRIADAMIAAREASQ